MSTTPPSQRSGLTPAERKATASLASIYALRMLGLFMILPVFALYAERLAGVTPLRVGIAISAYGLTQALLQIPFGFASDRFGRKPVIVFGLLLFAAGSVVAALARDIDTVIIGRALQGSGAIAAAVLALAADLTRDEVRTRVMGFIGVSIGFSFALALVLGPLLDRLVGVPGIFLLTALLALGGIAVVTWVVPSVAAQRHRDAEPTAGQFASVLTHPELLRLDAGILLLHAILTATFTVFPLVLRDLADFAPAHHWRLYLPVLLLSLVLMVPWVIYAERRRRLKPVFLGAIAVLGAAQVGLYLGAASLAWLALALVVMFAAFNVLEATLPSMISRIAPASRKGTAMGVYSTSQFLGAFVGGLVGGTVHGTWGVDGVFLACAGLALGWLLVAAPMRPALHLSARTVHVGRLEADAVAGLVARITALTGVVEAVVVADEGVAYLKVDTRVFDEGSLREFSHASG